MCAHSHRFQPVKKLIRNFVAESFCVAFNCQQKAYMNSRIWISLVAKLMRPTRRKPVALHSPTCVPLS